jgi:hypothetical protein
VRSCAAIRVSSTSRPPAIYDGALQLRFGVPSRLVSISA